jgi:NADP-dependent 3-hydroxy acid dehydrogenase YdfG
MSSVLITGASRGIGRAVAIEFARRGHRVVATARDPSTLAELDVNQRLALDVTDEASVTAAVAAAGDIDILIANAGVIFYAAVEATPLPELERLLNFNTVGAIRVAQAVLPQMRARGDGKLMFMSSVVGRVVLPPNAAYAATKWALEALVEALAIEVAPFGIQTTLLEPGAVSSGALDDVTIYTEEVADEVADAAEKPQLPLRIPIGYAARALLAARRASPDDIPFIAALHMQKP